ncbi:cellulose biosynthesis cyclic di-GMP-binding regulatory protein BcsB [Alteromonas marina]|uniref:cellulose biosynthesis cyclic di-GMP-binding regulatory protein BcsB n=1 Tax=unclassified Alteromonas TaxID=2614992 RepID=UPI0012E52BED|nr:cellulose biosynthesis cyclic di-GMP-binding regulatory protein BcsB [Alteromonas sp. KUL150]GFD76407.1 cellulose synthase BcsB subunit [Tenacibaculum sp. KUL113]GFD87477.1 cellulose synthase BcsB subunit [Alteromonas sp. KUL150]
MIKKYLIPLWLLCMPFTLAAQTNSYRLTDFYGGDGTVRLQGKSASVDIPIPLSFVADVDSALLTLEVVSSQALIRKRSQLYVRFNNATIGQIAFDPDRPSLVSEVTIPNALWRAGFNSLTLAVSQHYAEQCVDGNAPELWSEINVYSSTLKIATSINEKRFTLDALSGFFNPGIGGQRNVHLYTAREVNPLLKQKTLPIVAQALALRNQYQPLIIQQESFDDGYVLPQTEDDFWNEQNIAQYERTAWYLEPEQEQPVHVLVGTVEALSPVLSDEVINDIDGAFLKAQRTPAFVKDKKIIVPASYRLIVSGTTQNEVLEAAKALAVMDDAINPVSQVKVLSQSQMQPDTLQRNRILNPDNHYTFEDFGVPTTQFRDEGDFNKRVSFRLPADFYVPENASVSLLLDFGYGAGFGPGSVMNVKVNDELVHGLALNNINGQSYRDYQLRIPARFFKGGVNNLDFAVTLRPPLAGVACDDVPGSHLVFQLDNSSVIELPSAGHVAVQPNLAMLSETAYPFARFKSAPVSSIAIPSDDYLNTALTLSAKFAQAAQAPLLNVEIVSGSDISAEGSVLVLGTPDTLSSIEQEEFSTAIDATKRWSYRLQNNLYNQIRNMTDDKSFKEMRIDGNTVQESDLGAQAILTAQAHPVSSDTDTLFIMAAQTPELLQARVEDLVSLSLWGQMAGDFFAWKDALSPSLIMQVSEKYEVGEADDNWLHLRLWLSNNPWYWLIGFIILVFIVSMVIYLLLKRRNEQVQDSW